VDAVAPLAEVLELVRSHPGQTIDGLLRCAQRPCSYREVSLALAELERGGRVSSHPPAAVAPAGRRGATWWLAL
jgi:hypothetical protein